MVVLRRVIGSPYFAQLLSLGGSAALTFFSALFLLPEDRGLVAVFLAILSIGSYIACFGVQSEILQSAANGKLAYADVIIRKHVLVQFLFSVVLALGLLLLRPFNGMSDTLALWACAGVLTGSLFNNLSWRQYGSGRFFLSTALRGLIPLLTLGVAFGMYLAGSVSAEAIAMTYAFLQLGSLSLLVSWRRSGNAKPIVRMMDVYKQSSGFFLCQSESLVLARTPVLASGIWLDPSLTAVISISLSLAELQASLPQMRSAISFKEASASDRPRLTRHQLMLSLRALLPGTAIVLVLAFVAREFLDEAYSDLPLFVGLLTLGVATQAVAASAINILTARRSLGSVIAIEFFVIAAAWAALVPFAFGHVALSLLLWSFVVTIGLIWIVVMAMKHKRGRHL